MTRPHWYRNAIVYQADPTRFRDADGDGWGDLPGLTRRLDYVRSVGATALWLLPFYASPFRDGGYDVSDHLAVDPRLGELPDVVDLLEKAEDLGLRVIIELIAQHTSDQHRWFQEARHDRRSPYRDYYLWADEPTATDAEPIFPTVEDSVWTWDEEAQQFYRHVFYAHEPDLNVANPAVREEIRRIMAFWLRLGVSGFRIDAAPYMVRVAAAADPREDGQWLLRGFRRFVDDRRPATVLLGEADVPPEEYAEYFGDGTGLTLLLDFWVNNHLFLALSRGDAEPLRRALERQAPAPLGAQYAHWLRNHDELDLEQLSEAERQEVWNSFAPEEQMRVYGRGIRRRIAPMLDGDVDRIAMLHALLLSLPGTPILRYGDEIGMGDDLSLPERHSVRTPMQWADSRNGGFSAAPADQLVAPMITDGPFGCADVNVYDQCRRADSLLGRLGRMTRARLGLREVGLGTSRVLDVNCRPVFALRHEHEDSTALTLVNLCPDRVEFALPDSKDADLVDILCDSGYDEPRGDVPLALNGYGYRWLRPRGPSG